MKRETKFDETRTYRYSLWREWDASKPFALFICLNPSTADETNDDPTIRRCVNYSKAWGYGAFCMANIFAFRATDPEVMKAHREPIGPENDEMLKDLALNAGVVVAGWGNHGKHLFRGIRVKREMIYNGIDLKCLKISKDGSPSHPLYLRADLQPIPFPLT